jgi:hypothetical protein
MADNSDGWIKHEPGPCPIPDAKRWEWEYISISSAPMAVKDPVAYPAKYEKYWLDGSITHYRLRNFTPEKDAVIAELRDARAEAAKWQKVAEGLASILESIRDDSYVRQVRDRLILAACAFTVNMQDKVALIVWNFSFSQPSQHSMKQRQKRDPHP